MYDRTTGSKASTKYNDKEPLALPLFRRHLASAAPHPQKGDAFQCQAVKHFPKRVGDWQPKQMRHAMCPQFHLVNLAQRCARHDTASAPPYVSPGAALDPGSQ